MQEVVRDAEMVVQGQVGGILFVQTEVPVDAEAGAEQKGKCHVKIQILGVFLAAAPLQRKLFTETEDILQCQRQLAGDSQFPR